MTAAVQRWPVGLILLLLVGQGQSQPLAQGSERSFWHQKLAWLTGQLPEKDRMHQVGDRLALHGDSVAPYGNPWETHKFYTLPFCPPKEEEAAVGVLTTLPHEIKFRIDAREQKLCTQQYTAEDLAMLRQAVKEDYHLKMSLDGLPMWTFLGRTERYVLPGGHFGPPRYYLYTHMHFDILYHEGWLVEINLSRDPAKAADITNSSAASVDFSYSVSWRSTQTRFEERMDKYSKYGYLPQHLKAHWFGIICASLVSAQLLFVLGKVLLTVSRHRAINLNSDDAAGVEPPSSWFDLVRRGACWPAYSEPMWRHLAADVFRAPEHPHLFGACVGLGTQVLTATFAFLALALAGTFPPFGEGHLLQTCLVLYTFTAPVAGYVGVVTFKVCGGAGHWIEVHSFTQVILLLPLLLTFGVLNSIAASYNSTTAVSLAGIRGNLIPWVGLSFPLTLLGSFLGSSCDAASKEDDLSSIPAREIPQQPWYLHLLPQMVMAGLLPFSAALVELYYAFISIWGYKVYTSYSFLVLVFVLMIVQTATIVVILTFMRLSKEDPRWWWKSFLCGGSASIPIFGYVGYFYCRSDMSGLLQTAFFFGWMAVACFAIFLMLGAIGFIAALIFVGAIYSPIPCSTTAPHTGAVELPVLEQADKEEEV